MSEGVKARWKHVRKSEITRAAKCLLQMSPSESKIVLKEIDRRGLGHLVSESDRDRVLRRNKLDAIVYYIFSDGLFSNGLFSDGLFGLLNKGVVGWVLFALIGGFLYGMFTFLMEYLGL